MANIGYFRGFEGVGSIGGRDRTVCIFNGNGMNSAALKEGLLWYWSYGRLE